MIFHFFITVMPDFIIGPYDTAVNQSQTHFYHCEARGHPPPIISWRFNVSPPPPSRRSTKCAVHLQYKTNVGFSYWLQNFICLM